MSNDLYTSTYNPDVLSCIANLSNDEVFTPPEVANAMLDLLPQELFRDPNTKFLDPACKSGVFLREIAKRLLVGLEDQIPDLQQRVDHIFHKQLFGIAITELTSLLGRRSVYCSKYPNSKYSVSRFEDVQGNIRFKNTQHVWKNGKCVFCGASEKEYGDVVRRGLETHAYEFIHTTKPEDIFKMKFDVIIGNPPYQMSDGGNGASAIPLYHQFVLKSMQLKPHYLCMIIPARWYAGGRGMGDFRDSMLTNAHIKYLYDYADSRDCFEGVNIAGGVCYFLWDRDFSGSCTVVNCMQDKKDLFKRDLNEYPVFIRSNKAVQIIRKVVKQTQNFMSELVLPSNPFGFRTYEKGKSAPFDESVSLLKSDGIGYVARKDIRKNIDYIDKFNVIITRAMSGGNKPSSDGKYLVIPSTIKVMRPGEICAETYLCIAGFSDVQFAKNLISYLTTKFARFILLQALSSIMINRDSFAFVPRQDFSKPWTDEELYAKYGLTDEEINFIESMIKPMELEDGHE